MHAVTVSIDLPLAVNSGSFPRGIDGGLPFLHKYCSAFTVLYQIRPSENIQDFG